MTSNVSLQFELTLKITSMWAKFRFVHICRYRYSTGRLTLKITSMRADFRFCHTGIKIITVGGKTKISFVHRRPRNFYFAYIPGKSLRFSRKIISAKFYKFSVSPMFNISATFCIFLYETSFG
jgi:hypothetical protein